MNKALITIRKRNLGFLLAQHGTQEAFLEKADINPKYVTQIINASGEDQRGMSDMLARKIEQNLDIEAGWMDTDHGHPEPPPLHRKGCCGCCSCPG